VSGKGGEKEDITQECAIANRDNTTLSIGNETTKRSSTRARRKGETPRLSEKLKRERADSL